MAAPSMNMQPSPGVGACVLVVDDERSVADTLRLILQMAGYDAHAAYSGEDAVSLSRDLHPQLILSDVMMPGTDGIDAALRVRTSQPGIKVVLFSGNPEANAARARKHGLPLLEKPISPEVLLDRIKSELQN